MSEKSSKLLLERYQAGDSRAAGEIYARYAKRLLGLAKHRLVPMLASKVDADDVAQETFAAFFDLADKGAVRWDRGGDLWRLLSAIAINQVNRQVQHHTAQKRNVAQEAVESIDALPDSGGQQELAVREVVDLVERQLQQENTLTQRVFLMRLAGMSQQEIASHIQRSERTVRRVLGRLKASLQELYPMDLFAFESCDPVMVEPTNRRVVELNANYDDFDLLRLIKMGTFGKVYFAREISTQKSFAIKVLKKRWLGDSQAEQCFLNEAAELANLKHPNIADFFGVGPLPNGSWFIVLQYVSGIPLADAMSQSNSSDEVIGWLVCLADAIDYLHRSGVVHGDLNLSNVLVAADQAWLVDFGMATSGWNVTTDVSLVGGTAGFVAPELKASPQADVYSFGKIIREILSQTSWSALRQSPHLSNVVARMTSDDPGHRPTIAEVRKLLSEM